MHPIEKKLLSAGTDGKIRVVDLDLMEVLNTIYINEEILDMEISHCGKFISLVC